MRGKWEKPLVVVGVLFALGGVILVWVAGATYQTRLGELREVQSELATIQRRRASYQRLVENLIAYSRAQPKVDALLVPFGFKQKLQSAPQPPAAAPAPSPESAPPAAPPTGGRK